MKLDQMSPYELGLTSSKAAISYLKKFLVSGGLNEKRLAASALCKLSREFKDECKSAIPELLFCIREHPHTQTRQYALKTLKALLLTESLYDFFREIIQTDEKQYNKDLAEEILHLLMRENSAVRLAKKEFSCPDERGINKNCSAVTSQAAEYQARSFAIKKELVLLAKSVKYGQNCIAGREIIRNERRLQLGSWIRPISDHDAGALSTSDIMLESGRSPVFLDIVQINVVPNINNPTQPENWTVNKIKWKKTGRIKIESIFQYAIENPMSLWSDDFCQSDRITTDEYIRNGYNSSLCIIQPEFFLMEISTAHFEGREKKRRRGKFLYNGVHYDLAITDPDIDRKYFRPFPGIDDGIRQIPMDVNKCLLCISLAPKFNGYHYKLIATVIENG